MLLPKATHLGAGSQRAKTAIGVTINLGSREINDKFLQLVLRLHKFLHMFISDEMMYSSWSNSMFYLSVKSILHLCMKFLHSRSVFTRIRLKVISKAINRDKQCEKVFLPQSWTSVMMTCTPYVCCFQIPEIPFREVLWHNKIDFCTE